MKNKTLKNPMLKEWHVQAIKRRIDELLRLRCINVTTTLKLSEVKNKKDVQRLELSSTPFNTVPVIHSEITIESFVSSVIKSTEVMTDTKEEVPCVRFYVSANATYEGNGVPLFSVSGQVQSTREHVIFFEGDRMYGAKSLNSDVTNNNLE